ncbi:MAG: SdiA-regulated domain-containing protein [Saprospiraceae bacterium]
MKINLQDTTTATWVILSLIVFTAMGYTWIAIRNQPPQMAFTTASGYQFPYHIAAGSGTKMELGSTLKEISGITSLNETQVMAIQDEKGILYTVDLQTGNIVDEIPFDKDRDYEDLCLVGDHVFVVERDGDIYQVDMTSQDATIKYETLFSYRNDVETLGFDPRHNRLLIAPKEGAPDSMEIGEHTVGIYAFDLVNKRIKRQLVGSISEREIGTIIGKNGKPHSFKPSAIAVHPDSGNIYILASVGKILIVLQPDGNRIMHVQLLDSLQFPQPEGIAFDPLGNLLISSEGTNTHPASITKFAPTSM